MLLHFLNKHRYNKHKTLFKKGFIVKKQLFTILGVVLLNLVPTITYAMRLPSISFRQTISTSESGNPIETINPNSDEPRICVMKEYFPNGDFRYKNWNYKGVLVTDKIEHAKNNKERAENLDHRAWLLKKLKMDRDAGLKRF